MCKALEGQKATWRDLFGFVSCHSHPSGAWHAQELKRRNCTGDAEVTGSAAARNPGRKTGSGWNFGKYCWNSFALFNSNGTGCRCWILRGARGNQQGRAVSHGDKQGHLLGSGTKKSWHSLASHSCKKRWASSEPTALCLLNSSFTYWSPRALRSGGRARCKSKMRRYKARTREMCPAGITPRVDRTPRLRKGTKRAYRTSKPGISGRGRATFIRFGPL